MSTPFALCIGEILWDVYPDRKLFGGAPLNLAYRLSTLGEKVLLASRLGQDDLGRKAHAQAFVLKLNTSLVEWDSKRPTGTVNVTLGPDGVPDFAVAADTAYDAMSLTSELKKAASGADCICYGTLIQRSPLSRATVRAAIEGAPRALRVCDLNLRKGCFTEETVTWSVGAAQVLKFADNEVATLATVLGLDATNLLGFLDTLCRNWELHACVVTLGASGALAYDPNSGGVYSPGFTVNAVDTVGAGDSFTAGFVHAVLNGEDLEEACELGNAIGALAAGKAGGTPEISIDEIAQIRASENRNVDPKYVAMMQG